MTATDAGFLYLDRPHAPLQIAAVVEFSGSLSADALAQRIASRIAHMPRYAQRAVPVPLGIGHPQWEDAPDFDARDHVQRWALPAPGDAHELCELAAQLLERPLARERPLWEVHLLEGGHDGRSALLIKVHHCMADGLTGVRMLDEILDVKPGAVAAIPAPAPAPHALLEGSGVRVGRALGESLRHELHALGGVLDAVRRPLRAQATACALRDAAWSALRFATGDIPAMPWNERLGPRRRLAFSRLPLEGVARVRRARGGTVNDVVLCMLAGGLHRYLASIGIHTRGLELTALVPVSLRRADDGATPANRISAILVPLDVGSEDELARLAAMREITERMKSAAAWAGIDALLRLLDDLPAGLVAAAARHLGQVRIANLVASNLPGPREPRFLCGRPVEAIYPIVPITDGLGLGIAVLSYAGTLHVGINADPGLVPDLEKLGSAIENAFGQLLAHC